MERKRILMIDDDRLPMEYYIRSLERNDFDVKYFTRPDDAFRYLDEEKPHLDSIILDIMLPPGEKYKDEQTDQGLRTGILLVKDFHGYADYSNTPVIVLTNVRNPRTLAELPESDLLKIAFKPDYPPKKLVELLGKMLGL